LSFDPCELSPCAENETCHQFGEMGYHYCMSKNIALIENNNASKSPHVFDSKLSKKNKSGIKNFTQRLRKKEKSSSDESVINRIYQNLILLIVTALGYIILQFLCRYKKKYQK
jgi:hypothetical protein